MSPSPEIRSHDVSGVPLVKALWEALFDHHVAIGAAGLQTIPREASWPRRRKHYEMLFSGAPNTELWLAVLDDEPVGYALAYEGLLDGRRAMTLETLSVLPSARGFGIGTCLMRSVDRAAGDAGIGLGVVDVMGGNPRARELYSRYGYAPYSEAWMRSTPPARASPESTRADAVDRGRCAEMVGALGLSLSVSPDPDDTWESADEIVELSFVRSADAAQAETPPVGATACSTSPAMLSECFSELTASGLRTIQFEIPADPGESELRTFLLSQGFRLSTERLLRQL
ncbi:MAG: GNAT family N-acetyltransferase [Leucobacter sp.]